MVECYRWFTNGRSMAVSRSLIIFSLDQIYSIINGVDLKLLRLRFVDSRLMVYLENFDYVIAIVLTFCTVS